MAEIWKSCYLGELISLEYGDSLTADAREDGSYPVYGSNGIVGFHSEYLIKGPGIIIGRKGSIGSTHWSQAAFFPIDTTYYVKLLRELDWRWLYYSLSRLPLYELGSSTGVPGLSRNDVYSLKLSVPSLPEQRAIAAILDSADSAIQAADALIAKLQAERDGLLHDLLTSGVDENGALRDPEVHPEQFKDTELGRIPVGWEIRRLEEIAEVGYGIALGRDLRGMRTVEIPYLRVANVQDGYLDLSEIKTIRVLPEDVGLYSLQSGDILMTEGGDYDKLGRGAIWKGQITPCLHQNHIFRVRVRPNTLHPEYLAALSGSLYGRRYFLLSSKQSTNLASINSTQLKTFPVLCPPAQEQYRIISCLAALDEHIQIQEVRRDKLRVIKAGLVDDLLTGRVQVANLEG